MMIYSVLLLVRRVCLLVSDAAHLVLQNLLEMSPEVEKQINEEAKCTPQWKKDLWSVVGYMLGLYFVWIIYKIGFTPINRVKLLTEVGWGDEVQGEEKKKKHIANRVREIQRNRKVGDLPPPYPNGWFAIAESQFIIKNKVQSIQCLGEVFAVFRGEDGIVNVLDAYCPHLGANMGVGGIVKGNCLECPFHGWLFKGESGSCSHIPYARKVPEFTKVRRWTSVERNGFVFVWYHAEGASPQWSVPSYHEIDHGQYHYRGRTEHHILAHVQEIPENGSDLAHLGHLHVPNIMKGTNLTKAYTANKLLDIIRHEWNGEWRPLESPKEHIAQVSLRHSLSLFNGTFHILSMKVDVEQIGPALVILHFETYLGKGILVQTVTPEEPLRQKVVHRFYSSSSFIMPFAKLVILGEAFHVERDIMIWNNKTFLSKPLLVTEDKLISRFRRWYSQFYSHNIPKPASLVRKESLEW